MRYYIWAFILSLCFLIQQVHAQSKPSNLFQASPCGAAGFLDLRSICAADLLPIGTGTGLIVFNISPTITGTINAQLGTFSGLLTASGSLQVNGAGNTSTVNAVDTGTATSFTTPAFNFNTNETFPNFSSATTHFGFVIQAGKTPVGANSTGSRQAFTAQQLGAGGTSADYFTGGFEIAKPTAGSNNNAGNFTGNNPYCSVPSGMTPTSCVAEEADVGSKSNVINIREGIRVVDIASTGIAGAGIDAGYGLSNAGGIGFLHGWFAGDAGNTGFPIMAGGDILNTVSSSVVLDSFLNFSNITGVPTKAPIVLGANNKGIWWGPAKAGGSIVSETASGGGDIVLGNGFTAFRFSGVASVFALPNSIQLVPLTIAQLLAITCNAGAEGTIAYVKDTVGSAAPTYGATVAGGGANAVHKEVSCNGTNWQYN